MLSYWGSQNPQSQNRVWSCFRLKTVWVWTLVWTQIRDCTKELVRRCVSCGHSSSKLKVQVHPLSPVCIVIILPRSCSLWKISSARCEDISLIVIQITEQRNCCCSVFCSVLPRLKIALSPERIFFNFCWKCWNKGFWVSQDTFG